MKQFKFIALLVVLGCILAGCNNQYDGVSTPEIVNVSETDDSIPTQSNIIEILQEYNASLATTPQTRGIGWAGWLSVAIADGGSAYKGAKLGGKIGALLGAKGAMAGAIIGGAVVGGAASISQYKMARNISNFSPYSMNYTPLISHESVTASYLISKDSIQPFSYNLGLSLGLDSCSVKIAIQHNIILDKIDSVQNLANVPQMLENLTETEQQIVNSEQFQSGYERIVNNPIADDYDMRDKSDRVMSLFIRAVRKSGKSQSSLNDIISVYTSNVKKSNELTGHEKRWLCAGFAVMGYSFKHWSEKWPYEE